jgi:hypothetical protein
MYATVRRYEGVRTDPIEEGKKVNEGFKPIFDPDVRFKAYCWVDAGNGVMISTSVFEDQSSAKELDKRADDWVQANLAQFLPNEPQITTGEVVAYKDTGSETRIPIDGGTPSASATVRRYVGVTDPSEAGRRVKEGFLPLISPDCYCWVDAGNGVMISTSVFEDQAGAPASNSTAADYVRENLAPLLPNPPQITAGKVVAITRPKR